jgi:hypothetical protein
MSMTGPLGGGAEDPGASTINVENVDGGPLEGDTEVSGVPTINTKKH